MKAPLCRRRPLLLSWLLPWCGPAAALQPLKPLVDMPLRRLRLPRGGFGADYVIVPVDLPGQPTQEFVLDSGMTLELVTPALKAKLKLKPLRSAEAVTAGGTRVYDFTEITGASVGGIALPTLHASVTHFPMEHIEVGHDVVGMLGLEFMDHFDVDLDFPNGRLRLWQPGDGAANAIKDGLNAIPTAVLGGTLLAVRVAARGSPQPFIGIIDTGASFSTLSMGVARLAGVRVDDKDAFEDAPRLWGIGIDGRPMNLPIVRVPLQFDTGAVTAEGFEAAAVVPHPHPCAVGDLPVFSETLGPARGEYAALIGLDVLALGRTVFAGGTSSNRTLYWKPA
ncbi:hypothetical protein M885DRAFT_602606 [Pelagophyceae sp. CCMP2097]|nr:hypothetical protein M885DRAFT_602606 [Pelagophyceae sp. CCMP2097]